MWMVTDLGGMLVGLNRGEDAQRLALGLEKCYGVSEPYDAFGLLRKMSEDATSTYHPSAGGYIYAFSFKSEDLGCDIVKVGVAESPKRRLIQLKRDAKLLFGATFNCQVLSIPFKEYDCAELIEGRVHAQLRNHDDGYNKLSGEWYRDTMGTYRVMMRFWAEGFISSPREMGELKCV